MELPATDRGRTTYQAKVTNGTSSPLRHRWFPAAVLLDRSREGAFLVRVVGAISFASHVLQLQRLSRAWVT